MRMILGIGEIKDGQLEKMKKELSKYATCLVARYDEGAIVTMEGDVVQCECVVAICDKYRFSGRSHNEQTSQKK